MEKAYGVADVGGVNYPEDEDSLIAEFDDQDRAEAWAIQKSRYIDNVYAVIAADKPELALALVYRELLYKLEQ